MDPADDVQPVTPNPKRFWWLKRLSLGALVLILLLVGLRLFWGHRVQARLDDTIAEIQAKGEPILFEDLVYEPLVDQENGAWYLTQALQNWPSIPGQPGITIHDTDWYIEGEEAGFTDPITDNAAYLASCEPVFDLLRQAGEVEQSSWGGPPTRPLFYSARSSLSIRHELSDYIDDAARRAMNIGDTKLFFRLILFQQTIARHFTGQQPYLIDSLIAISVSSMSAEFIEKALPQIDPAEFHDSSKRKLAIQIIEKLTDTSLRDGLIQGFINDRTGSYDYYECLIDGTDTAANLLFAGNITTWVIDTPGFKQAFLPAIKNEQEDVIRFLTEMIEGIKAGVHHSIIQKLERDFDERVYNNRLKYPILVTYFGSFADSYTSLHQQEALNRCAAIALAIKLYEADHGKRPDTLVELVPDYIAAIPIDPFSKTGEPIRYNAEGIVPGVHVARLLTEEQLDHLNQQSVRPYPLLYSIGEDGRYQNGGPLNLETTGELDDWARYQTDDHPGDIWFMLDAWPEAIYTDEELGIESDPFGIGTPE